MRLGEADLLFNPRTYTNKLPQAHGTRANAMRGINFILLGMFAYDGQTVCADVSHNCFVRHSSHQC